MSLSVIAKLTFTTSFSMIRDIPIFGLEGTLMDLVRFIRGAAGGYGTERRVLLLHGPVGSAKSTICRLLKKGMERYSQTSDGAWYTFRWVGLPTGKDGVFNAEEKHFSPCTKNH